MISEMALFLNLASSLEADNKSVVKKHAIDEKKNFKEGYPHA